MRSWIPSTCLGLAVVALVSLSSAGSAAPAPAAAEGELDGEALFLEHKCNTCHAVPAAEIVRKSKSDKTKGSDLGGPVEGEFEALAAFLRKQGELEGMERHKREFKGTDEELQAIFRWLAKLATPGAVTVEQPSE